MRGRALAFVTAVLVAGILLGWQLLWAPRAPSDDQLISDLTNRDLTIGSEMRSRVFWSIRPGQIRSLYVVERDKMNFPQDYRIRANLTLVEEPREVRLQFTAHYRWDDLRWQLTGAEVVGGTVDWIRTFPTPIPPAKARLTPSLPRLNQKQRDAVINSYRGDR